MVERELEPAARRPEPAAAVRPRYNVRLVLAIWFVAGIVDVLIALRFLLKLLGASTAASFTSLVYGVSDPLIAPFGGIFPEGVHRFYVLEPAALVAIVIYALIGWGLVTLVRIVTSPGSRAASVE